MYLEDHILIVPTEVARIMGSDCTPNGLRFQFTDRFRPMAKRQLDMLAAGLDPKHVSVGPVKGSKGTSLLLSHNTSSNARFLYRF